MTGTGTGSPNPINDLGLLRHVMHGIECLLLDFDGPVCSVFAGYPAPEVASWMREALDREGIALGGEASTTDDPMLVLAGAAAASPLGQLRAEQLLQEAELECIHTATPTAGASQVLDAAARTGVRVVVVSNNSEVAIRAYLQLHRLEERLHAVVGRDGGDASLMKPDPHLVRQALRAASGGAERAVLVGDSVTDVHAASAAHVRAVGYANKPWKLSALAEAGAAAIITEMGNLALTLEP